MQKQHVTDLLQDSYATIPFSCFNTLVLPYTITVSCLCVPSLGVNLLIYASIEKI